MARARTFGLGSDDETIEVEILNRASSGELFYVLYEGKKLVRHRDRLEALDEEARALLMK